MTLTPTHYSTLHLPPLASPPSIRKAYKSLALTSHPDNTRHLSATARARHARLFRKVQEAYDVLGEPKRKRAYDKEVGGHGDVVEGGSTFHPAGSPSGETSLATRTRTRTNTAMVAAPNARSRSRSRLRTITSTPPRTTRSQRSTNTPTSPRTSQSQPPSPIATATEQRYATREAERDIRSFLSRRAERRPECGMEVWKLEVRLRVWRDMCGGFAGDGEVRAYCEGRVGRLEGCVGGRGWGRVRKEGGY